MHTRSGSELLLVRDPSPAEVESIGAGLMEHNRQATGGRFDYPCNSDPGLVIDLAVRDAQGAVVGGVSTSSVLGLMWLETLWVADELRRRGIASWLVLEAERIAHERGCVGAGTWTFSWQGADFYPTIGYRRCGVFDGYPFGITEHVLAKRLPDPHPLQRLESRIAENVGRGLSLATSPTRDEMRAVCHGLHDHCVRHAGEEMDNPGIAVRLVLKDGAGAVVGGLDAFTTIRILVLEALWVDERYRGRGYGRRLVEEAEAAAKAAGCVSVSSHCMSFQSPGFFRKLGYGTFGEVDAYIDGHTEDLLIKRL